MGPSQGSKVLGLEQVGLRWTLGGSAGDRDMVPSSVYVLHQLCVHKQPTAGRHVHAFHWWIPGRYFTKKSHKGNGVAVRSLARRQCSPGSIPARCHMWAEFVVDSRLAPGFLVFLPPRKPTFPNSNSTSIEDAHENQLRLMFLALKILQFIHLPQLREKNCFT